MFRADIYFIIIALVLVTTFCFLFFDIFSKYQTSASVVLIPKNESIALHSQEVTQNLVELSNKPSFLAKIIKSDQEIKKNFAEKGDIKRALKIERAENSTLIDIEAYHKNESISKKIVAQSITSLLSTASQYYDIKTDVDIRIAEKPITQTNLRNWQWIVLLGFFVGLILAFFIQVLTIWVETSLSNKILKDKNFKSLELSKLKISGEKRPSEEGKEEIDKIIMQEESDSEITQDMKEADVFEKYATSQPSAKRSGAPSNLPVAPASNGFENKSGIVIDPIEKDIDGNFIQEEIPEESAPVGEPSEEEYKKRLNQLLSGRMR